MTPRNDPSNSSSDPAGFNSLPAPTKRAERLASLDILRGVALLCILVVNIEDFAGPESLHDIPMGLAKAAFVGWHANLDLVILALKWLFVEGKMRSMFAMLFGAGCVLLTERLDRRGQAGKTADIFLRRNMWLALFGLIHGTLIWGGDILLDYGLCALLFLYPFRHVRASRLIVFGLFVAIVGGTLGTANYVHAPRVLRAEQLRVDGQRALDAEQAPSSDQRAALDAAAEAQRKAPARIADQLHDGRLDYLAGIPDQADDYISAVFALFKSGFMMEVVGAMLLGMGLYRSGYLSATMSPRLYLSVALAGYAISAPVVLVGIANAHAGGFSLAAVVRWMYIPYCLQQATGMLANLSVLLLIIRKNWLRFATRRLGAVGQTAFSNYILTSLICRYLFSWGPLKLYGSIEYYQELAVVAGIWCFNLTASALWLRFFNYGPLEWMWRSLTYWQLQPLRASLRTAN